MIDERVKDINANEEDACLVNFDLLFKTTVGLSGKGTKVLAYIIENIELINNHIYLFVGSYNDICKETKFARQTVVKAINSLVESGFLIPYKSYAWIINPSVMFFDEDMDKYMQCDDEEDCE